MQDLQARTRRFAVDVIPFCKTLPMRPEARVIRNQLLRSATSVGANYRAACHAQSHRDFISTLSIVEEEADESQFWFELLHDLNLGEAEERTRLGNEAHQITSMMVASKKTARASMDA